MKRLFCGVVCVVWAGMALAARANPEETAEYWLEREAATLARLQAEAPVKGPARNIILFVGDGMGVTTITATRIMAGQRRNPAGGEEHELAMDKLPYSALSKTYSVNQQTSDSAPTATALLSGVKTKDKVIGVGPSVIPGDHRSVHAGNKPKTILHLAKQLGKSAGVVTTTRLTHATPAACYAHSPQRDWESDASLQADSKEAHAAGFPDIARQLVEFSTNTGLSQIDVALGGGRALFLPKDPMDPGNRAKGVRLDGRNLAAEWVAQGKGARSISTRDELMALDTAAAGPVLGLFSPDHMAYACDRNAQKEPSLVEMTAKALQLLNRNTNGFFLMVEGGRIDHGHHAGNAYRALTEAIEFDEAIRYAAEHTSAAETLIIVTADHSHTLTMGGYGQRGNPILGLVKSVGDDGSLEKNHALDLLGKPFTTLTYANGPGYTGAALTQTPTGEIFQPEGTHFYPHFPGRSLGIRRGRPILTEETATFTNYLQEAAVPLGSETHGGEDVAIFAGGPQAHLIRGVREQNYLFQVMKRALTAAPGE